MMRNASIKEVYYKERERLLSAHKLRDAPIPKNICPSLKLGLLRYGFDVKVTGRSRTGQIKLKRQHDKAG